MLSSFNSDIGMDVETENRIAAILMKEAAELRRQADKDGVDAYFKPSNVRGRPNSRFLASTVLGVQQANRIVEVNEMWRIRQKEKELDDRVKKNDNRSTSHNSVSSFQKNTNTTRLDDCERNSSFLCSSSKRGNEDDGLRDHEIEEFLHSRVKRGRGAVGSRMDETGPYLVGCKEKHEASPDEGYRESRDKCVILGPEKPLYLKVSSSSDEECPKEREKRPKRNGSSKRSRRKHDSKEKSGDIKKKRREKKRSKRHN